MVMYEKDAHNGRSGLRLGEIKDGRDNVVSAGTKTEASVSPATLNGGGGRSDTLDTLFAQTYRLLCAAYSQ